MFEQWDGLDLSGVGLRLINIQLCSIKVCVFPFSFSSRKLHIVLNICVQIDHHTNIPHQVLTHSLTQSVSLVLAHVLGWRPSWCCILGPSYFTSASLLQCK